MNRSALRLVSGRRCDNNWTKSGSDERWNVRRIEQAPSSRCEMSRTTENQIKKTTVCYSVFIRRNTPYSKRAMIRRDELLEPFAG